jgi:acyl-CoA thioester hydrolase
MVRIRIDLPDEFDFSTDFQVSVSDINYGMHLGADRVLPLVLETQMRFLAHLGYEGLTGIEGVPYIMSDSAIVYKSEAGYGEELKIEVAVVDFQKNGFDFVYRISRSKNLEEVARVKTGMLFLDYEKKVLLEVPEKFRARFEARGASHS